MVSANVRCGERRSGRVGSGSDFRDVGTTVRANRGVWYRGTVVGAIGYRATDSAIGDVQARGKMVASDRRDRRDGLHDGRRESRHRAELELHRQNRA